MSQTTGNQNQKPRRDDGEHGEGNRAADRDYRADVKRFIDEGGVGPASREASEALDDPEERKELEEAERVGKSRAAQPSPRKRH